MRTGGQRRDVRASALWGSGKRGTGSRSNALWGSGKRRTALLATLVLTLVVPLGASAGPGPKTAPGPKSITAFVAPGLLTSAQSRPADKFSVIVQGKGGNQAAHAVADVLHLSLKTARTFSSIDGVAVDLTGAQIVTLAADKHVTAITADSRVRLSALSQGNEKWPFVTGVTKYTSAPAATIAVVDSGIDASRPEFAGRIAANVNLTSLPGNSSGDGRGHGTFVAGIAAGAMGGRGGAAPTAKIVSLDVMDDQGMAKTSDVIAAADWILANRAKYGIRVANFSLHSSVANSFMYDPLDKAVESLWFNNVVVVVAAGNYGNPNGPSGVPFAPGNDPFVITVGASDTGRSVSTWDDVAAPWSAYGYTLDGFAKPDLAAPGRYMVGPVPVTSTLYTERADHIVDTGYMELSGTSFAAPIVSGVAALILGKHPDVHCRPGQGRSHARREADASGSRSLGGRRRGQCLALARVLEPAEGEQGTECLRRLRFRRQRSSLRLCQLGGQGEERRFVGRGLVGRRLLGRRLLVDRELGGCILERSELRLGLLGRHGNGCGFLGRSQPRERLVGRQRRRRDRSARRRCDRPGRARCDPRRHAGSVNLMRLPGVTRSGESIEGSPNGGCPRVGGLLRSAMGSVCGPPVRRVAKERPR